ncbi:response regulator [Galactobacter valiniphilus]|uniref:Response regulator n=1 Tax=Galactobacter valiniphilus TaxID=2676122 RepID=A0A399JB52_9MICC|nr:response regulator [Galactobacter valiniphilus]RII42801.1 response regulator [Galactobacter valiniphilus]
MSELRVLILEDEPRTASVYEEYLMRIPGTRTVQTLGSTEEARRFLAARVHQAGTGTAEPGLGFDMVLVDMNLPDGHGLEVLRRLRATGWRGGAIALTAAAEREVLRGAVALGITQYLLKPFSFEEFATAIAGYRELHARLGSSGRVSGQEAVDAIFSAPAAGELELPKGLTLPTLGLVREALASQAAASSASELGAVVGLSRVTARRYLEHLVTTGQASRATRHGTPGRPEVEYSPTGGPAAG